MHVFVESNFLLELAFEQEHYLFCQRIVAAANSGRFALVVPQYALTEVFQTLGRRRAERTSLRNSLAKEIEQHRRETGVDLDEMDSLSQLASNLLITRTLTQKRKLFEVVTQLAAVTPGPALNSAVIAEAAQQEEKHSLSSQDALVYASVLAGLRALPQASQKLFITRNKADFNKKLLVEELRTQGCELLFDFRAAAGRLSV